MGLTRVMVVDYFKEKSLIKLVSIFSMSALISPLIMPTIGGYIQELYGWRINFLASCITLSASIIAFKYLCIETSLHRTKLNIRTLLYNYKFVITDKKFICWTLLNSSCVAAYYSYTAISPFLFQNFYKFSPIEFGYICAIITSANFISKSTLVAISHKCNNHLTNGLTAIAITLIGGYLYIVNASHYETILLLFTFMLVIGFATPIISSHALAKFDKSRGIAGSLYSTITLIITSAVCNVVGILPDLGIKLLGTTFIALGTLMICAAVILKQLDKKE